MIETILTDIGEFLDRRGFLRYPSEAKLELEWVHGPWMVSVIPFGEKTDVIVSGVGMVPYGKMLLFKGNRDRTGLIHLRGPTYGSWHYPWTLVLSALTDEELMPLLVGIPDAAPVIRYWLERSQDWCLNGRI